MASSNHLPTATGDNSNDGTGGEDQGNAAKQSNRNTSKATSSNSNGNNNAIGAIINDDSSSSSSVVSIKSIKSNKSNRSNYTKMSKPSNIIINNNHHRNKRIDPPSADSYIETDDMRSITSGSTYFSFVQSVYISNNGNDGDGKRECRRNRIRTSKRNNGSGNNTNISICSSTGGLPTVTEYDEEHGNTTSYSHFHSTRRRNDKFQKHNEHNKQQGGSRSKRKRPSTSLLSLSYRYNNLTYTKTARFLGLLCLLGVSSIWMSDSILEKWKTNTRQQQEAITRTKFANSMSGGISRWSEGLGNVASVGNEGNGVSSSSSSTHSPAVSMMDGSHVNNDIMSVQMESAIKSNGGGGDSIGTSNNIGNNGNGGEEEMYKLSDENSIDSNNNNNNNNMMMAMTTSNTNNEMDDKVIGRDMQYDMNHYGGKQSLNHNNNNSINIMMTMTTSNTNNKIDDKLIRKEMQHDMNHHEGKQSLNQMIQTSKRQMEGGATTNLQVDEGGLENSARVSNLHNANANGENGMFIMRKAVELQDGSDLREAAVQAMMKTPGWKPAQLDIDKNGNGILSVNDMYIFAPREEYERLRQEYSEDPSVMPAPYHSLLTSSIIESLKLPKIESKHSYIRPYDAAKVIRTAMHFRNSGFILLYSGHSDRFSVYVLQSTQITSVLNEQATTVEKTLSRILRQEYPDRFQKGQPDYSVVFSAGDSIKMNCMCMPTPRNRESAPSFIEDDILNSLSKNEKVCNRYDFSPIWNFGSGFVNPEVMPTSVTFPPWGYRHLSCFESFRFDNEVCSKFSEMADSSHSQGGLYFGNHLLDVEVEGTSGEDTEQPEKEVFVPKEQGRRLGAGSGKTMLADLMHNQDDQNSEAHRQKKTVQVPIYDYLRPQIMWRGSDFVFLSCLDGGNHYSNLTPQKIPGQNNTEGFTKGLFEIWDTVTPRWKAVALTLEAESIAMQEKVSKMNFNEELPWIDAKFIDAHRSQAETDNWHHFLEMGGNVVAGFMEGDEAASFKYHIDFGGGGGTTWNGVKEKLALPGVLFHHHTPTYDWFHEDLIPWVHYIPISTELEDLKEKFDWAESHPEEAKAISDAATAFVRYMGTMEYWERMYDRLFLKRLAPTIEAYQPMGNEKEDPESNFDNTIDRDEEALLLLAKELKFPLKKVL